MEEEQEGLQQCLGDKGAEREPRQHHGPGHGLGNESSTHGLGQWRAAHITQGSREHVHDLGQRRAIPYLFSEALLPSTVLLWLLHASRSPEWATHRVNQLVTRMCRVKCAD